MLRSMGEASRRGVLAPTGVVRQMVDARLYSTKKPAANLDTIIPGTNFTIRQLKAMELERQQKVRKASREQLALMRNAWAYEKKVSELIETYKARQRWSREYQQHLSLEQMKAHAQTAPKDTATINRQKQIEQERISLLKTLRFEKLEQERQQAAAMRKELASVLEKGSELFSKHPLEIADKQFVFADETKTWVHSLN